MRKNTASYIFGAIFVIGASAIIGWYFIPRAPVIVVDRLCEYVRDQLKINCVNTLASDEFVHPGSIVNYLPSKNPANDRLDLPVSSLTDSSCLVRGAEKLGDVVKGRAGI